MSSRRRLFLKVAGAAGLGLGAGRPAWSGPARIVEKAVPPPLLKPPRLKQGDWVGLVNPASATFVTQDLEVASEVLAAMGLQVKRGAHVLSRYGYLAGRDQDRAADLTTMFTDPEVKGILAVRGGWGCARLLPHLDFDLIRRHPKVLLGYSDVTALLLAIHARTGLATFHGPVGISSWPDFSVAYSRRVLFDGEAVAMANPTDKGEQLVQTDYRVATLTAGRARGRLLGGNLTVLSHLVGTPYLPEWDGAILFLEDIGEDIYRVDRMLTQLGQAGILKRLAGVVFGTCKDCKPGGDGYGSLTLEEVLADHITALGVPAYAGAAFGHVSKQFTLPVGVEAEIDATAGSLRLLEPAVA